MKTVFLLLFVAFIGLVGHAQALSGAAATYEKSFWTAINKAKGLDYTTSKSSYETAVTQATTNLKQLKKAAPDYKVEKHDAELQKLSSVMQAGQAEAVLAQDLKLLDAKMAIARKGYAEKSLSTPNYIENAEYQLQILLKHSPTYDHSKYTQELTAMKSDMENKINSENQARDDAGNFRTEYDKAFIGLRSFSGNVQTGNEDADRLENQLELKELKEKVKQFIATDLAKKAETLHSGYIDDNIVGALTKKAADNDAEIAKYKKYVFEAYRKGDNWISYDELLALEIFWEGNSTLFPSHSEYKTALANTRKVIAECGSEANMEEIRKKNYGQYLTTVKMDAARAHDAALEAEIKRIFLTTPPGQNANVVKVNIVYEDWTINRHAISGVILSREREARVVTKDANGSCWVHQFGLFQRHDGSKYSASEKLYLHPNKTEILCENVR